MNVQLEDRAEIALRSLDPPERRQVEQAIQVLEKTDLSALNGSQKLKALKLPSTEKLYSFRASKMLRLILSAHPSQWIIEDIMGHDRLSRLLHSAER